MLRRGVITALVTGMVLVAGNTSAVAAVSSGEGTLSVCAGSSPCQVTSVPQPYASVLEGAWAAGSSSIYTAYLQCIGLPPQSISLSSGDHLQICPAAQSGDLREDFVRYVKADGSQYAIGMSEHGYYCRDGRGYGVFTGAATEVRPSVEISYSAPISGHSCPS